MRFIIGGNANGKYARVLELGYGLKDIYDCSSQDYENAFAFPVLYKLNFMVKNLMLKGIEPVAYIEEKLKDGQVEIIVCDEVGGGVVPANPSDRAYREAVGRLSCVIARQAQIVERVYCGISTVIKSDEN